MGNTAKIWRNRRFVGVYKYILLNFENLQSKVIGCDGRSLKHSMKNSFQYKCHWTSLYTFLEFSITGTVKKIMPRKLIVSILFKKSSKKFNNLP